MYYVQKKIPEHCHEYPAPQEDDDDDDNGNRRRNNGIFKYFGDINYYLK